MTLRELLARLNEIAEDDADALDQPVNVAITWQVIPITSADEGSDWYGRPAIVLQTDYDQ